MSSQEKSPDAFRTISEVADDLDLPQHVLRFWETRFSQIKPLKRGGGRRYYRPDDVELLKGIRHLLYEEGYTIKGVQRILKEQGPRFVMQIWQEDQSSLQAVSQSEKTSTPGVATPLEDAKDHSSADAAASRSTPLPKGVLPDDAPEAGEGQASGFSILGRFRTEKPVTAGPASEKPVSKEDVRRLQATLFELLECKRTLDQAR
ncbi:MerR family transcriptional regulator [Roseibium denhamense]|uniref:Transcriptional regulator, MerR family n=1 Tax=Roseibium denhamense TaxID=76305 RepID=A0ABY1NVY3_9HYPH|nr:MerR family transcriptional regulator [Roseibium denhamense]MTI04829.1 MerR family transcriptional regulator [Roseibium denhamense]SMP18953.1 transcriptional regulator, MerR family [Roseibium denhamense]